MIRRVRLALASALIRAAAAVLPAAPREVVTAPVRRRYAWHVYGAHVALLDLVEARTEIVRWDARTLTLAPMPRWFPSRERAAIERAIAEQTTGRRASA